MGDSWLAMEACLRLEPSIIHRVVLKAGYRFFDYLTSKTSHFPYKIQKFRTFLSIYLYIWIFFRTFAARIAVRACMYIHTYKKIDHVG